MKTKLMLAVLATLLTTGCVTQTTVGTNALTPDTVYPKAFVKVDVDWEQGRPLVTLPGDQATGYSETDAYVVRQGVTNAYFGQMMGTEYSQLVVPTPYARYTINPITGKLQ